MLIYDFSEFLWKFLHVKVATLLLTAARLLSWMKVKTRAHHSVFRLLQQRSEIKSHFKATETKRNEKENVEENECYLA